MKFMCITEIRIISADFIYDLIYGFFLIKDSNHDLC